MPSTWRIPFRNVFTHTSAEKCLLQIAAPSGRNLIIPRFTVCHRSTASGYAFARWAKINSAGTAGSSATIVAFEDGGTSGESAVFTITAGPAGSSGVDTDWSSAPTIATSGGADIVYEHDARACNGGTWDWTGIALRNGGITVPQNTSIGLFVTCTAANYAPVVEIVVVQ